MPFWITVASVPIFSTYFAKILSQLNIEVLHSLQYVHWNLQSKSFFRIVYRLFLYKIQERIRSPRKREIKETSKLISSIYHLSLASVFSDSFNFGKLVAKQQASLSLTTSTGILLCRRQI